MDRLTALALIFAIIVAAIAVLKPSVIQGPNTSIQPEVKVEFPKTNVTTFKAHVSMYEGVGPNHGKPISGVVKIYKDEIDDPYKIPATALMAAEVNVNGTTDVTLTIDDSYKLSDDKQHVLMWFVGNADDHYPAVKEVQIPSQYTDTVYESSVSLYLDHVATMSWDADAAYRGTDSPVLRYSATDEAYKTDFVLKPTIDFETDLPSGVFVLKQISITAGDANEMSKIDSIDIQVGDTDFGTLTPNDLPKTQRLDKYVTVSVDNPLEVKAQVVTTDGTESLTSGAVIFNVELKDVLGNTFTEPVKAA